MAISSKKKNSKKSSKKPQLVLERVFDVPVERLWKAFTNEKDLAVWWGPDQWTNPRVVVDLRPQGKFEIDMTGPGFPVLTMKATFLKVKPNKWLSYEVVPFDLPNGQPAAIMVEELKFSKKKNKSKLITSVFVKHSTPEAGPALAGMAAGFSQSYAKLRAFFESGGKMDLSSFGSPEERSFSVKRLIDAPIDRIWEAICSKDQLETWWGPDGFTNSSKKFEFQVGGEWIFTMIGPDRKKYPNYVKFINIQKPNLIVYQHGDANIEMGFFVASISLNPEGGKTEVGLKDTFNSKAILRTVIESYNALEGGKQNLARLDAFVSDQKVV